MAKVFRCKIIAPKRHGKINLVVVIAPASLWSPGCVCCFMVGLKTAAKAAVGQETHNSQSSGRLTRWPLMMKTTLERAKWKLSYLKPRRTFVLWPACLGALKLEYTILHSSWLKNSFIGTSRVPNRMVVRWSRKLPPNTPSAAAPCCTWVKSSPCAFRWEGGQAVWKLWCSDQDHKSPQQQ